MASNTLKQNLEHGVLTLQLNRPDSFNSFNREMSLELIEALEQASLNDQVRSIVLTGTGKAFCAGQDLNEATDDNGISFEIILNEHYNPIIRSIRNITKPVIAAVNGVAAGAGANIALCCDMIVAKSTASFTQAFSKIGLVPDSGGTFFLPRMVGLHRANVLMMLSDKITAKEAQEMGLVYKVCDDEEFDETVYQLAERLAKMPTKALGMTKKLINAGMNNALEDQLEMEALFQIQASESNDYKEGVNAFLEKRKPVFKGN